MPLPLPDPPLHDNASGVLLRPWGQPGDAAALASAWSDPEIAANSMPPDDRSDDAARRWIAGEAERRRGGVSLDLVIGRSPTRGADTDGVMGEVGLAHFDRRSRAELGFWLTPEARVRGIARVAVGLITPWALDPAGLGLQALWARVRPENERAAGVLHGAGYTYFGEASGFVIWVRDKIPI